MQRTIFLSYARENRAAVDRLINVLRLLRYELWLDETLFGGSLWWDEILQELRRCDLVLTAISPQFLDSSSCNAELEYAIDLNKVILPVQVAPVPVDILPRSLAVLQMVPFLSDDQRSTLELVAALNHLPPSRPLASPLPDPPPPPLSPLSSVAEMIRSPSLSPADQLAVVTRLGVAAQVQTARPLVADLARQLLSRHDLLHQSAKVIERLLVDVLTESDENYEGNSDNSQRQGQHGSNSATVTPTEREWAVSSVTRNPRNTKTIALHRGTQEWRVFVSVGPFYLGVLINDRMPQDWGKASKQEHPFGFSKAYYFYLDDYSPKVRFVLAHSGVYRVTKLVLLADGLEIYRDS